MSCSCSEQNLQTVHIRKLNMILLISLFTCRSCEPITIWGAVRRFCSRFIGNPCWMVILVMAHLVLFCILGHLLSWILNLRTYVSRLCFERQALLFMCETSNSVGTTGFLLTEEFTEIRTSTIHYATAILESIYPVVTVGLRQFREARPKITGALT